MSEKIIFFGHHKCASRFMRKSVLRPFAQANGLALRSYEITDSPFHFESLDSLDIEHQNFQALSRPGSVLMMLANASDRVVQKVHEQTSDFLGVHVVRDPRQVLVSNYFHHLDGHTTHSRLGWVWDKLIEDRRVLEALPQEEGILYELENITKDLFDNQFWPWQEDSRVLELRAENLGRDQESLTDLFDSIKSHLGHTKGPRTPRRETFSNSKSQPWDILFTPKIRSRFKDQYGQLLVKMGYEKNLDW